MNGGTTAEVKRLLQELCVRTHNDLREKKDVAYEQWQTFISDCEAFTSFLTAIDLDEVKQWAQEVHATACKTALQAALFTINEHEVASITEDMLSKLVDAWGKAGREPHLGAG